MRTPVRVVRLCKASHCLHEGGKAVRSGRHRWPTCKWGSEVALGEELIISQVVPTLPVASGGHMASLALLWFLLELPLSD